MGLFTYQIANMLIKLGMPFKTLRRYPHLMQLMWHSLLVPTYIESASLGLDVRLWSEGSFMLEEYQTYLEQHDEIISGPDERAALMAEGIIQHLAIDARADEGLTLDDGPSMLSA